MTTFEERIENVAQQLYVENGQDGYKAAARRMGAAFLEGGDLYEWANLPGDRSAGWVDLTAMRDELVEDGVLVRLEVPEDE